MTLQASGQISLLDIQNEFGGSNPIQLNEYYGVASGIPTSGQISLSNFYGASALPEILWGGRPTLGISFFNGSAPTSAGIRFETDTSITFLSLNGTQYNQDAYTNEVLAGNGDLFEIRYGELTGFTPNGTLTETYQVNDTELNLTVLSNGSARSSQFNIYIRRVGEPDTEEVRAVTLDADGASISIGGSEP